MVHGFYFVGVVLLLHRNEMGITKMNVQQLANELNVTENDVISLVNMVYTSMKQDLIDEIFLSLSEHDQVEMVNAYVQAEVKKFSEFCVTLLTNDEKRKAFELYVQSKVI